MSNEDPNMGPRRPIQATLALWSVVILWVYSWGASLTQLLIQGRDSLRSDIVEPSTPLAGYVTRTTMLLLVVTLSLSILLSISDRRQRPAVRLAIPFAIILPWAVIYVFESALISGVVPKYYEFILPIMILAFYLAAPAVHDVCVLLGRIGVATAAASVVLGLVGLGSMPYGWHQTDDKAIIGDAALAGPYSHSNILGLAMALSLPFVLLALRGKERLLGSVVVGLALVWSASRISIAAALLAVCVLVVVESGRLRHPVRVITGGWIVAATAIIVVPMRTSEDAAFTNRGLIWKVTRFYVPEHPVLGWGTRVFEVSDNQFASAIGARAGTAHNMWLTLLAVGGWTAVAGYGCRPGRSCHAIPPRLYGLLYPRAVFAGALAVRDCGRSSSSVAPQSPRVHRVDWACTGGLCFLEEWVES